MNHITICSNHIPISKGDQSVKTFSQGIADKAKRLILFLIRFFPYQKEG
jgi:hypothetical protein